jgi:molecular chaperone DnaK (HSP70)
VSNRREAMSSGNGNLSATTFIVGLLIAVAVLSVVLRHRAPPKAAAVGIDLGTTFSAVGVFNTGVGDVLLPPLDDTGSTVLPSNVEYDALSDVLSVPGTEQCSQRDLRHCYFDSKRFIGRTARAMSSPAIAARYPFQLDRDSDPDEPARFVAFEGDGSDEVRRSFAAHEISAALLSTLNRAAAKLVGRPVKECVIGVPVDFDAEQRRYTTEAAAIAGMRVLALINEPTLAAMAYGLHERTDVHWVIVYDLGGGTLDVSVLEKESSAMFHIMASAGDTHFGGQDFNYAVYEALRARLAPAAQQSGDTLRLLRAEVERAKRALNSDESDVAGPQFSVTFDAALRDAATGQRFELTRQSFEAMIGDDLLQRATAPIARALAQQNLTIADIGEVVMVGGSSRLRCIRAAVAQFFENRRALHTGVPPEHAVAIGATLYAARLTGQWPLPLIALEHEHESEDGEL